MPQIKLEVPAAARQWSSIVAPRRSCRGGVREVVAQRVTVIAVPEKKVLDHQRHEIVVTKHGVPPVLRALRQAIVTSASHAMASDKLAVVEAQLAARAALHFLLGKEDVLVAIGVPVTSTW